MTYTFAHRQQEPDSDQREDDGTRLGGGANRRRRDRVGPLAYRVVAREHTSSGIGNKVRRSGRKGHLTRAEAAVRWGSARGYAAPRARVLELR